MDAEVGKLSAEPRDDMFSVRRSCFYRSSHISFVYVERAARVLGGQGEVRQHAEGCESDGDAVADVERRRARFGLRARDEDGDAEALLRRVDRDFVERRLALFGPARDEVEPDDQSLVCADEML